MMKTEYIGNGGFLQRDSVEHEEYAEAYSTECQKVEERDGADLLEKVLDRENLNRAYKRVKANKGASGVDGMTVDEALPWLKEHRDELLESIRNGKYKPSPVRRVEIPKDNGGVRKLGIPTVIDRIIQQAIAQVLTPIYEPKFSDGSYGYRPHRSAKDAVLKVKEYADEGYKFAVCLDLSKYFDTLCHELLMNMLRQDIKDKRLIDLIKKYLKSGVMENGMVMKTEEGSPQGGLCQAWHKAEIYPPLLSNIMLNELDIELESRGQHFTRYADDVVIVVKSKAAATRVMYSITKWIEKELGFKVNATKTKVTPPSRLKYLGFGFWKDKTEWKARPHEDSVNKFKRKLKALCKRSQSIDLTYRIKKINEVTRGWINYFRIGSMKQKLKSIDEHLRTMIRVIIWKQWKVASKREWGLLKLGVPKWIAHKVANWGDHYQFVAQKSILKRAISKEILTKRGLVSIYDYYQKVAHI